MYGVVSDTTSAALEGHVAPARRLGQAGQLKAAADLGLVIYL